MITRGPMVVRDVDILTDLARRAQLHITFSIPTLDDDVWRKTEPGTAHPRQRLRAYLPQSFGEKTMDEVARLRSYHRVADRRLVVLKPPPEPEQLRLLN